MSRQTLSWVNCGLLLAIANPSVNAVKAGGMLMTPLNFGIRETWC